MKIINAPESRFVAFKDLKPGEVFQYDDKLYMRLDHSTGLAVNVVRLDSGIPYQFDNRTQVVRTKTATLCYTI